MYFLHDNKNVCSHLSQQVLLTVLVEWSSPGKFHDSISTDTNPLVDFHCLFILCVDCLGLKQLFDKTRKKKANGLF